MLPRIKKIELGRINVNDSVVTSNFFLHSDGVERLDSKISTKDLEKALLHEPEVVLFGTGFMGRAKIPQDVTELAGKTVEVRLLRTPEALKKFQELSRAGKKVVAYIHVGQ